MVTVSLSGVPTSYPLGSPNVSVTAFEPLWSCSSMGVTVICAWLAPAGIVIQPWPVEALKFGRPVKSVPERASPVPAASA